MSILLGGDRRHLSSGYNVNLSAVYKVVGPASPFTTNETPQYHMKTFTYKKAVLLLPTLYPIIVSS
jgi:hypothetical protein